MGDEGRAVVKTYVPPEQKSVWREHADDLDMSQSEYLRTMVQAGRKGFLTGPEEGGSGDATPGGDGLEDRVLDVVDSAGVVSWDELVAELSGDFEDRLDDAVQTLSENGTIRFDPRREGYVRQKDT
ncbi:DUF5805 domain-containing protein [Halobacterium jilantaiense]|uniref:Uncharacterized protein n=1 Tax=Halobacterium jilantaiense TaxID=355548 RepID=A0A1I0N0L1_9EURY|nr:DUF5805 domain-containing protein [Halobacterium jilantaiense]SEV94564.1 hypothetical protein SAMN04487945_0518 [Halobacterium jilantaiense]